MRPTQDPWRGRQIILWLFLAMVILGTVVACAAPHTAPASTRPRETDMHDAAASVIPTTSLSGHTPEPAQTRPLLVPGAATSIAPTATPAPVVTPTPTASPVATPTPTHPGYIYFKKEYDQIWRYDLANDQERLLVNRQLFQRMAMSPDGNWLTYPIIDIPSEPYSPRSIGVLNTRTGEERQVTQRVAYAASEWLPDGRLLVLELPEFHINADRKSIVEGPIHATQIDLRTEMRTAMDWPPLGPWEESDLGTPSYTEDFDCVARFTGIKQSPEALQVLCRNDSQPRTIAKLYQYGEIAWSPDGQTLAFHGSTTPGQPRVSALYLWQRSSQTLHTLAGTDRDAFALTWSPDGKWLAFQGEHDLCFLDVANEQVTCHAGYLSGIGVDFSWSFDSQYVVINTCEPELCAQVGCDCKERALVTVRVPDGQLRKLLTTNVDPTGPDPVWGR